MKRIAIAAAAALTLVGPLAATSAAADPPRYHNDNRDHDRNGNHWNNDNRNNNNHHQWRRGERLGAYERAHYRQVDWRRDHLREPPRGYHYVRDDRGETLLVGVATGTILGIILANQ